MDYTEYCEAGDHDVEEDELINFGVTTSCNACQEEMHRAYTGPRRIR